ncbi:MAG: hypothetical protein ACR5LF_09235 [Symbiopectobacterium sp.]
MAKHFTEEFKLEAAKLVVDGYTYVKAADEVNDSRMAITPLGFNKLRLERQGISCALSARGKRPPGFL